jgi:hypothetical protein
MLNGAEVLEKLGCISENQSNLLRRQNLQPEQEQALKAHLQAIAQILYDDSDPDTMQTLEGIEMTVRQKIQAHVSPELENFLLKRLQEQQRDDPDV